MTWLEKLMGLQGTSPTDRQAVKLWILSKPRVDREDYMAGVTTVDDFSVLLQQAQSAAATTSAGTSAATPVHDIKLLVETLVSAHLERKMKYSVTDAADVGKAALDKSLHVRPDQIFDLVAVLVPSELVAVPRAWRNCRKEDDVQALVFKVCKNLSIFHVLDTHKGNFHKNPTAKIDVSLSDSDTARWPTLVSAMELKLKLNSTSDYKAAVGQLKDRWEKIMEAQPTRDHMVGAIMGQDGIELWSFSRDGSCKRTGLTPLVWKQDNIGWQMLVAYLKAPAGQLGYVPLPVPASFLVRTSSGQQALEQFKPLAGVPHVRPVYTARLSGSREEVVVKLGSKASVEHEVSFLSRLDAVQGFPRLLASDALAQDVAPGVSHYLIISPVGQLLGDDSTVELVCTVFRDIASAIEQLEDLGILHRDISPSNIVHSEGRGILVDFHAARLTGSSSPMAAITGKLAYMALSLHSGEGQHSGATDMESLFYSLMDVASGGRALRWRNVPQELAYDRKYTTLNDSSKWEVALGKCREELRPWIDRLRCVVCSQGGVAEYLAAFKSVEEA